jgi:hypothetical protein
MVKCGRFLIGYISLELSSEGLLVPCEDMSARRVGTNPASPILFCTSEVFLVDNRVQISKDANEHQ